MERKNASGWRSTPYRSSVHLLFDLETTGLDPEVDRIRAFGGLAPESGDLWLLTTSGSELSHERRLIRDILVVLGEAPEWIGWNLTEFDLPFLSTRAAKHGIDFPLVPVNDEPAIGKYGRPRKTYPHKPVRDLAYENEENAAALKVKWSLQPLAREFGWEPLVALTGADMPDATLVQVAAHCLDDLEAMAHLLRHEGRMR
jgi:DNA polymerase III epsilon subunit-like protein